MISRIVFVLTLLSKIVQLECHLIHTPVGENHVQRNLNLINELRNSKRFALDGGVDISKNQTLSMTDDQGVNYVCVYENTTSSGSKAQPGRSPVDSTTIQKQDGVPSHDLSPLRGVCVEFPQGWWTYRWCHKQQVTQYHKEKNGEAIGNSWSLGVYDSYKTGIEMKKSKLRKTDKGTAAVAKGAFEKYSYYFSNGQHCDETKTGRKSVVHVSCCHQPAENGKDGQLAQNSMKTFIALQSLKESELCTYEINVCTPLVCPSLKPTPTQNRFSVHSLLKPLETVCMQKHEGWWTYEFCYRSQIRQLHLHTSTSKKGKRETKIQSQFIMGVFAGSKHAAIGEVETKESIRRSIESTERKAFLQKYTEGHDCGITGAKRSTDVYFICKGKDTLNELISIEEDRTCHYNIIVNTPLLCSHPLFKAKDDVKKHLVCKVNE